MKDKVCALSVLQTESLYPKYCISGPIFASRVEKNVPLHQNQPAPERFVNRNQVFDSDRMGFYIEEDDTEKFFWLDDFDGFYDENGFYYDKSGTPKLPPYVK